MPPRPQRTVNRRHWHGFFLHDAAGLDYAKRLETIAGPRLSEFKPGLLQAPPNCAWIVNTALTQAGIAFTYLPPQLDIQPATQLAVVPERKERTTRNFKDYQLEGILTKMHMPGGNFWWEPGAGKTRGGLEWGLSYPGRVLFVTRSGARTTIEDEAYNCYSWGDTPPQVLEGRDGKVNDTSRLVICGWDLMLEQLPTLLAAGFTSAIFDEIHRAKSRERWNVRDSDDGTGVSFSMRDNRAGAVFELANHMPRRLGMTATPVYDRASDLYGQLSLVQPGEWGRWDDWAMRYCNGVRTMYGLDAKGRSNEGELVLRMVGQPIAYDATSGGNAIFPCHKVPRKVSHGQLPKKVRQVIYVRPEDQVQAESVLAELKAAARKGDKNAVLEAKLTQACSRKRSAVVKEVQERLLGGVSLKFVIFTARTRDVHSLADALRKKLPRVKLWATTGEDSEKVRKQVEYEYMGHGEPGDPDYVEKHPGPCIIVATRQCWGESYNLQDTDVMMQVMMPINTGQVEQSEGRGTRHGQVRQLLVIYMVAAGTVDEKMVGILLDKLPDAEKLAGTSEVLGLATELARGGKTEDELRNELMDAVMASMEAA